MDALQLLERELPKSQNPALVYLASLGAGSFRSQEQALRAVVEIATGGTLDVRSSTLGRFPWHLLKYQHTAAIRAALAQRFAPATANKVLSALRSVLREAWQLGLMTAEDYQRAANLKPVIGETLPRGREVTPGELSDLMRVCQADSLPSGVRDAAIIGLLYAGGLRRAEVVNLNVEDVDAGKITVRGKRNKERLVYLDNGALDALTDWLSIRRKTPGPLFWHVNKAGGLTGGRLTSQAVYLLIAKRAQEAGLSKFSPHDLRRSFVSDLLDRGADISTVSRMAGHANVQTTARYDRRPEEAKVKAAKLLRLPYRKR